LITKGRTNIIISAIVILCCLFVGLGNILSATNDKELISEYTVKLQSRAVPVKPINTIISSQTNISHVVVKFSDDIKVRKSGDRLISKSGTSSLVEPNNSLNMYLGTDRMRKLFNNVSESKLDKTREVLQLNRKTELADLNNYYRIEVTDYQEAEILINELNALDEVEIAYFKPMSEPAGDIDPPTPDFLVNQDYREAAPDGVDADYANTLTGGDGTGVKIIDIEGGWRDTHEDLDKALGALITPSQIEDLYWRNHGTAVIGAMIASDNDYGVTGICPGADIGMISIATLSASEAIIAAADTLQQGDFILIELHAPGPHYNFEPRTDQLGYVCEEYWQDNFDAIQYAWAKGIVVIEAGGNGAEDFDDAGLYGSLFDTTYRNSHAIIVGAGAEAASASNLEKKSFSNYGERVNLQGYGSGVYTTGYGSLFDGGGDENQYYTTSFSGTSSASPIVTGAAACLQGYYKATYGASLTSDQIRDILVPTGTPQLGDTFLHIGPRPDLFTAISTLTGPASLFVNPLMLDTTLDEGEMAVKSIWIHNRSTIDNFDFTIIDNDSLAKTGANWLTASPQNGTVSAADSVEIDVTLDASLIEDRISTYKGILEISWGPAGGSLDSLLYLPVFLDVPCFDTTYTSVSSDEPSGPTYSWVSAYDNGWRIPFSLFYGSGTNPLDDGTTGPYDIGFEFNFYDSAYSEVYIGVNGAISFEAEDLNINGFFRNLELPGAPFNTFIAPLWADLIFDTGYVADCGIYFYTNYEDTCVIEWYQPANFNQVGDTTMVFEIILTRYGGITFQYKNIGTSGLEQIAMIGISDFDCKALSHLDNNQPIEHEISTSEAIRFENTEYVWILTGNVDGSPNILVSDLVFLVDHLFKGGPPPVPEESGDVNCDKDFNVADLVFLVDYIFKGGPPPCYYLQ